MGYTTERNNQIVIELLKYHGIKKIIVSPGATNVSFVASIQNDSFFELYSSVDERSAAYIACGLAEESGEAVALSCTGATASRNYFPGLTEAYYRKLPILAITSTMPIDRIGHNIPQMIDRTNVTNDIAKGSYYIPMVDHDDDEWKCTVAVNEAILELSHHGDGPVHMNVETRQSGTFDVSRIDYVQPIDRIESIDCMDGVPNLDKKKIAIFVGAHSKWSDELLAAVDRFCRCYNAIVIGDHTSNYKGAYFVPSSLVTNQRNKKEIFQKIDLMIHLGNVSGSYLSISPKEVWRVCTDGKLCDTFRKLRYVFEMEEVEFFEQLTIGKEEQDTTWFKLWRDEYNSLRNNIHDIPFSNVWIAKQLSMSLPENSILHLGILNSLRSWNYFEIPKTVFAYSNTGGFGIDGIMSSALGASLATNNMVFCILGDLAFFYDMNSLGNRILRENLRIMIINNGHGQEFLTYGHRASQFGNVTEKYIAAAGHYGNKSRTLIKHYAEDLGFKYISADSEESFEEVYKQFVTSNYIGAPIIFEIFTNDEDEREATRLITGINGEPNNSNKGLARQILGEKGVKALKGLLRG